MSNDLNKQYHNPTVLNPPIPPPNEEELEEIEHNVELNEGTAPPLLIEYIDTNGGICPKCGNKHWNFEKCI